MAWTVTLVLIVDLHYLAWFHFWTHHIHLCWKLLLYLAHSHSSVTLIWATKSLFWWLINSENSWQLHLKNHDFSSHYWSDLTHKIGCFNLRNNVSRHYSKLWGLYQSCMKLFNVVKIKVSILKKSWQYFF